MKVNLLHNKIIKDTITPSFVLNFNENLVPKLAEKYSSSITEITMYEDHLKDGFTVNGEFYYPLVAVIDGEYKTEWIKWNVSAKKLFENQVPYSYIGAMPLNFELSDEVPEELADKIKDRSVHFSQTSAPLIIQSASPDKTFLSGKYSQSFIDLMCSEISKRIEKAFSVTGIRESGIELMLVFAPGTYMEHIMDNVTYRRLLITARACSARDLWIKWTNLKGNTPLSVSDSVSEGDVEFALAEDVPQKVREKEYRFLVRTSSEKYQFAMGRKNITEWRDLIKRVIKRGELTLTEQTQAAVCEETVVNIQQTPVESVVPEITVFEEYVKNDDVASKLSEMLSGFSNTDEASASVPEEESNSDISELLKNVLGVTSQEPDIKEPAEQAEVESAEEIVSVEDEQEKEETAAPVKSEFDRTLYEDELRRRIEAEIREKLEAEARARVEAEADELRRAKEALIAENERLAAIAEKQEAERLAKEKERAEEAERLRLELEAKERAEARERERIQEAARIALVEQQRIIEERKLAEERAAAEEKLRAEEEARLREEERIKEEQRQREIEAREAEEKAKAAEPNYISKNARLLFRRPIDPNVTKRIHEIILTTIKYYHKENVYIKIKATVPDSTTVNLNFVKIPENETDLLINIIKVLGKSELGIVKVYLE